MCCRAFLLNIVEHIGTRVYGDYVSGFWDKGLGIGLYDFVTRI